MESYFQILFLEVYQKKGNLTTNTKQINQLKAEIQFLLPLSTQHALLPQIKWIVMRQLKENILWFYSSEIITTDLIYLNLSKISIKNQ